MADGQRLDRRADRRQPAAGRTRLAGGEDWMTVVIAKQYEKDLRVDGSMKARAWDFMMKLNNDPDAVGLDLKMPQGVIDRRVRTARVDQNFRAVLFALPNDMLVMAAIKPHDEAYA